MTRPLAIVALLLAVACGQKAPNKEAAVKNSPINKDWKIIDKPDYSIEYPPTWELDQSGKLGVSFFFLTPLESTEDKFRENVNLLIQDLKGRSFDLKKFTDLSIEQVKTYLKNAVMIESKPIKNGDTEYQHLVYTGDQEAFHLKFEQYYFFVNEKAYVLTFTSEQDKFDTYKETGENILNSFKLK